MQIYKTFYFLETYWVKNVIGELKISKKWLVFDLSTKYESKYEIEYEHVRRSNVWPFDYTSSWFPNPNPLDIDLEILLLLPSDIYNPYDAKVIALRQKYICGIHR